jgi:putative FmdB family regulatory protein
MEVLSAAMPTYEYLCRSCGKRFEAWQKITDEPITVCPNCSGEVHRVIYPVGLMFKGSGFYSTDNRGGSSAVSTPAADGGDASKAGTAEKDSAPAAGEAKTGAGAAASTTTAAGKSE